MASYRNYVYYFGDCWDNKPRLENLIEAPDKLAEPHPPEDSVGSVDEQPCRRCWTMKYFDLAALNNQLRAFS